MIDQLHYRSKQEERKGTKSNFSWGAPLHELVLGRASLANQEIISSCQHKKSPAARAHC